MILALLQLTNGRINLGSLSFRRPNTGLRKTATRSELEVSGARSPTKILYSLGYCCRDPVEAAALEGKGADMGETDGTEDAQLRTKGFAEFGMVTRWLFPLFICARTDAACAGVGNVRKQ